jgi:hypothetical protein
MLKLTQIGKRLPGTVREAHSIFHRTPLDGPKRRQFDGKKQCSADLSATLHHRVGAYPSRAGSFPTMLEEQHAPNFNCRPFVSPARTSKPLLPVEKSCHDAPYMCAGGPARTTII